MSFNDKHRARLLLFQALYQMRMTNTLDLVDITLQFKEENIQKKYCRLYFSDMFTQFPDYKEQIDQILVNLFNDVALQDISPVELSVCRLAVYELLVQQDISYKVIITEALKIQSKYGSEDGFKLVNGVLDKASRLIREDETKA